MGRIALDKERCKGCLLCTEACPDGNLVKGDEFNSHGYYNVSVLDTDRCRGCALCAEVCPDVAIEVWK